MDIPHVAISLGGSLILFILLLAAFAGLAFLFYRYTLPPLPPRRRLLLSTVRSLALALLLLIFFEPIMRLVRQDRQQPVIAVLIDNSQSISINDGTGDRANQVRGLLRSNISRGLFANVELRYFTFSSKLSAGSASAPDSLALDGELTDLSTSFSSLKSLLTKENIRASILISDGNYTSGSNPLYAAEETGIPVFTVGVGDTNQQKDILVEKVATNNIAYTETRVPVEAVIRSSGYDGDRVEVTLSEGAKVLDRSTIALQRDVNEYNVHMHFEASEEGTKKFTVNVSRLPGELTDRNNSRTLFVKVLKSKLNILLLAGAPDADVAALRQCLIEDGHINVRSLVQMSPDRFYEGAFTLPLIDSADCLVLVGYPSAASSVAVLQQLGDAIAQKKKPVFFINSKTTDYGKLQYLEPALPFSWSAPNSSEVLVGLSIPDRQKHNPLIELEGKVAAEAWQQLPPVFKTQTVFRSKPESQELASCVLQNIGIGEPLVLLRNVNRQKAFAITGHGIWRWRLLAQGNAQTETLLPMLVTNVVRWLTTNEADKRIRILPTKEVFTTAEAIGFTGQVYDDQLHPVDNAEVVVQVEQGAERFQLALNGIGNGMYEGAFDGLREGDYAYSGHATRGGTELGEDRGKFSVGQVNVEFLETRMNKELLEQLAFRTGGTYHHIGDVSSLPGELSSNRSFEPTQRTTASEIDLWNWKYLAMVLVLFSVEWFLRKRNGMV